MRTVEIVWMYVMSILLILMGTEIVSSHRSEHQHLWMSDVAKSVNFPGSYVFVEVSVSCQPDTKYHTIEGNREVFPTLGVTEFMHADFDIDLLTGELRPMQSPKLPKPGFKCKP